jgi:hypothetical protein
MNDQLMQLPSLKIIISFIHLLTILRDTAPLMNDQLMQLPLLKVIISFIYLLMIIRDTVP